MNALAVLSLAFAFVVICKGQAADSGPVDLSGSWVDGTQKITLIEKGDTIKVHEMDGDRVVADYSCNLSGEPCQIKEERRPVTVTLYYNGSKLVEIKQRGRIVEKRLFSLGSDGKTMQVEIVPLSSDEKTSARTYRKENT